MHTQYTTYTYTSRYLQVGIWLHLVNSLSENKFSVVNRKPQEGQS